MELARRLVLILPNCAGRWAGDAALDYCPAVVITRRHRVNKGVRFESATKLPGRYFNSVHILSARPTQQVSRE